MAASEVAVSSRFWQARRLDKCTLSAGGAVAVLSWPSMLQAGVSVRVDADE